jgi:uncharacterized damage-inducible protein DinB
MSERPNPYGDDLGDRDPRKALRETPVAVRRAVERLGREGLDRSLAPGKWTAAEILVHLAQVETIFQARLRLALATPGVEVQSFDQDVFMRTGGTSDGRAALEAYVALRGFTLPLIERLDEHSLAQRMRHPEYGELSVAWLLSWCAGHERRHLAQLEQLASQA